MCLLPGERCCVSSPRTDTSNWTRGGSRPGAPAKGSGPVLPGVCQLGSEAGWRLAGKPDPTGGTRPGRVLHTVNHTACAHRRRVRSRPAPRRGDTRRLACRHGWRVHLTPRPLRGRGLFDLGRARLSMRSAARRGTRSCRAWAVHRVTPPLGIGSGLMPAARVPASLMLGCLSRSMVVTRGAPGRARRRGRRCGSRIVSIVRRSRSSVSAIRGSRSSMRDTSSAVVVYRARPSSRRRVRRWSSARP